MSNELQIIETSDAIGSLTRAEIDMQISTAKKYPRDFSRVKKQMLSLATLDEETAASCFYKLARQGKSIEGPSVRMAEIAVSCFQNIRAGSRIIGNDGKTITAQSFCHDLENNVMVMVETKRRITDKSGNTYSEDMQVVTGNAACAIGFRNAVHKVVPMALIKPVYEAAKRCAVGDIKTLSERRTQALKYFSALGVNEAKVLQYLGKTSVENLDLGDVESLLGLSTAIKDGSTTVDEAFSAKEETAKPSFTKSAAPIETPAPESKPKRQKAEEPKTSAIDTLKLLMEKSRVTEAQLLVFLSENGEQVDSFAAIDEAQAAGLVAGWMNVLPMIAGGAK